MKQTYFLLPAFALGVSIGIILNALTRPVMAEPTPPEPVVVVDTLTDWNVLQLAIMMKESRFNPDAQGRTNDYGIFQITPIYVAEANRLSEGNYTLEDAFSIEKSIEMFGIVQGRYNPDQSIERAIHHHNPGASSGYARVIKDNIVFIQRYEAARTALLEYERAH